MNIADIVLIAVVLMFAVVGFFRGFMRSLLNLIGNCLQFIVGYFLAKPVARLIDKVFNCISKFSATILNELEKALSIATDAFTNKTGAEIKSMMGDSFLEKACSLFIKDTTTYANASELLKSLSDKFASILTIVIAFVATVILLKIILFILAKIFDAMKKSNSTLNGLDRVLGVVLGVAKAAVVIAVVFVASYFLQAIPSVSTFIENTLDGSGVLQPIYNWATEFLTPKLQEIDFSSLLSIV